MISPCARVAYAQCWAETLYRPLSIIRHSISAIKIIETDFHDPVALSSPPCSISPPSIIRQCLSGPDSGG